MVGYIKSKKNASFSMNILNITKDTEIPFLGIIITATGAWLYGMAMILDYIRSRFLIPISYDTLLSTVGIGVCVGTYGIVVMIFEVILHPKKVMSLIFAFILWLLGSGLIYFWVV